MSSPKSSLLKLPTGSQKKLAKNLSYFRLFSCRFGYVCHYQHTSMRFLLVLLSLSLSPSSSQWVLWVGLHGLFPFLAFWFFLSWKRDSWIPLDHAQSEHKCDLLPFMQDVAKYLNSWAPKQVNIWFLWKFRIDVAIKNFILFSKYYWVIMHCVIIGSKRRADWRVYVNRGKGVVVHEMKVFSDLQRGGEVGFLH